MTTLSEQRVPAFDPFGEPMDASGACADARGLGSERGYGETRRAAVIFWALVLLFVGARVYLADQPAPHGAIAEATPVSAPASALR